MCFAGMHSWFWLGRDTANNDVYRCAHCGVSHTPALRTTVYEIRTR